MFDDIECLDIIFEDESTKVGTFFLIPLLEEGLNIELTLEGRCISGDGRQLIGSTEDAFHHLKVLKASSRN